jgi:hypothetical protein
LQALEHASLLELLAEVSVAFVGFSMLASVLRPNLQNDRVRFFGFRDVAETSLIATLGSIGPPVLAAFDFSPNATWRLTGGAVGSIWVVGATAAVRRQDRSLILRRTPFFLITNRAVAVLVALFALANVLYPSAARHVLLVVLCLTNSAVLFLGSAFSTEYQLENERKDESDDA